MLKMEARQKDKSVVFLLQGDLDIESSNDFKNFVREKLKNHSYDEVLINLEKVEYIDSSGLGSLIAISKDCRLNASKLKLINVPNIVFNILKLTRLDLIIEVER
jgi:anti-sigma B factor antagonist